MNDLADMKRVNWAEAFSLYCQGNPLQDVAMMLTIDQGKLEIKASSERWHTMRARVEAAAQKLVPTHPDEIERRSEMIQQNREENYRAWRKLRDDAVEVIDELRQNKGKKFITQLFHNKGDVIEHIRDMSINERVALGNYLQVIAQGTYAALGDRVSSSGAKDESASSPNGLPGITIILPGVISKPRAERAVVGNDTTVSSPPVGTVIDLRE